MFSFCKFLSIGRVPKKLSTTYECLKYLEVDIEVNSKEILATLCILRSSPNLEELKIEVSYISGVIIMDFDLVLVNKNGLNTVLISWV